MDSHKSYAEMTKKELLIQLKMQLDRIENAIHGVNDRPPSISGRDNSPVFWRLSAGQNVKLEETIQGCSGKHGCACKPKRLAEPDGEDS